MKSTHTRVAGMLLAACSPFMQAGAQANLVDTLTGQIPGHEIGCSYTFSNGDPSIPCASDIVAADGTVSFVKPNAPYDHIVYIDKTPAQPVLPIGSFFDVFAELSLSPDTQYPILRLNDGSPFGSFFDVFVELDIQAFNDQGLQLPGVFHVGDLLQFDNGTNALYDGITIPGFSGEAVVAGFNRVSVPEPGTLLLLAVALLAMGCAGRHRIRAKKSPAERGFRSSGTWISG